jgi:hypothetical protein
MTRFIYDATTLQFDCDPIRPGSKRRDGRQLRETDSAGSSIVYGKGNVAEVHRLTFPRLSTTTLASLTAFVSGTIYGVRYPFTWIDHADVSRTARLTSSRLRSHPIGPNQHRVEIEVEVTA